MSVGMLELTGLIAAAAVLTACFHRGLQHLVQSRRSLRSRRVSPA